MQKSIHKIPQPGRPKRKDNVVIDHLPKRRFLGTSFDYPNIYKSINLTSWFNEWKAVITNKLTVEETDRWLASHLSCLPRKPALWLSPLLSEPWPRHWWGLMIENEHRHQTMNDLLHAAQLAHSSKINSFLYLNRIFSVSSGKCIFLLCGYLWSKLLLVRRKATGLYEHTSYMKPIAMVIRWRQGTPRVLHANHSCALLYIPNSIQCPFWCS